MSDAPDTVVRRLEGGMVVRRAEAADVDAVAALNVAVFGAQDEPPVRALLEGPVDVEWLVVADGPGADRPGGGTLACACARIPHRFLLDGVPLPGCQIENVTTDERYRGRGLVRHLFTEHHRRAADDGQLVQVIGGIPYFYRKLGYGYGFEVPETFAVDPAATPPVDPTSVTVRPMAPGDVDWIVAAETTRPRAGLTVERTRATTEVWLARTAPTGGEQWESVLVAERDGVPVGWVRAAAWPEEAQFYLLPGDCPDVAAAEQLLAHGLVAGQAAADRLDRPLGVLAVDRPGTPWSRALHRAGRPRPDPRAYYTRVPDPVAALRAAAPVLSARLAASGLARDRGEVTISLYERGVRVAWEEGRVTAVEPAPPDPDPFEHGGVGVAPDWFPALLLGRWGASELVDRTDDTMLGEHAAVMDVLFPARPNDVVSDL